MAEEWLAADQLKDHQCAAPYITELGVRARKNFRGHVHTGAAGFLHHLKVETDGWEIPELYGAYSWKIINGGDLGRCGGIQ